MVDLQIKPLMYSFGCWKHIAHHHNPYLSAFVRLHPMEAKKFWKKSVGVVHHVLKQLMQTMEELLCNRQVKEIEAIWLLSWG